MSVIFPKSLKNCLYNFRRTMRQKLNKLNVGILYWHLIHTCIVNILKIQASSSGRLAFYNSSPFGELLIYCLKCHTYLLHSLRMGTRVMSVVWTLLSAFDWINSTLLSAVYQWGFSWFIFSLVPFRHNSYLTLRVFHLQRRGDSSWSVGNRFQKSICDSRVLKPHTCIGG